MKRQFNVSVLCALMIIPNSLMSMHKRSLSAGSTPRTPRHAFFPRNTPSRLSSSDASDDHIPSRNELGLQSPEPAQTHEIVNILAGHAFLSEQMLRLHAKVEALESTVSRRLTRHHQRLGLLESEYYPDQKKHDNGYIPLRKRCHTIEPLSHLTLNVPDQEKHIESSESPDNPGSDMWQH